jgi:hypothetical protein
MSQCCHIDETRPAVFLDAPAFVIKKVKVKFSPLQALEALRVVRG